MPIPLSETVIVPAFLSDRKSTRLNSSHQIISYAVFCLKKKNKARAQKLLVGAQGEVAKLRIHLEMPAGGKAAGRRDGQAVSLHAARGEPAVARHLPHSH